MNTVTGIPDAAWYFARLDTASPSPPVRAYGDSSGARCTTGAGVPSGRVSGADGTVTVGATGDGACFFFAAFRTRGFRFVAGVVTSEVPSSVADAGELPFSPFCAPGASVNGGAGVSAPCSAALSGEGTLSSIDYERRRGSGGRLDARISPTNHAPDVAGGQRTWRRHHLGDAS